MRINGRNNLGTTAAETTRTSDTQSLNRTESTRSAAVDPSEGSSGLSATLGKISQALSAFNVQHAMRVQTLTSLYESGQYQSDSAATSGAMLEQAFSF